MINQIGSDRAQTQSASKLNERAQNDERRIQHAAAERRARQKSSSATEYRANAQSNERVASAKAAATRENERTHASTEKARTDANPPRNETAQEKRVVSLIDIFA